ncbi:hypothetical protein [Kineococcus arenarius]|uniref:hypothetical protein n=1 Tax=Kineococcus sp. SYSU DK007 TaxID=3383128 RepID=UPI003D7CEA44
MTWEAVAACTGLIGAGAAVWQLRQLRIADLKARAIEIESVSVATVVEARPRDSDVRGDRADWTYTYAVHNPGRFPLSDVHVTIDYRCQVRRRRGLPVNGPRSDLSGDD